jgi:tetratricopeptide (TPR) repeat protein
VTSDRRIALALAVMLALGVTAACGNGHSKRTLPSGQKVVAPKLAAVKPEAMREFDDGIRVLNLGGPEAGMRAKERFLAAVKLDRTVWEAWHNLGTIAFSEGADEEAIEHFTQAIKVNPAHLPSLLGRAEARRRAGETKDARADFERAIAQTEETDPVRRDAAARLAALLRDAGQYEDAIDVLRDTLRTTGANAQVYVELGLIYLAQNRDELAGLVISKAALIDDKDPAVYNAAALIALRQGKSQEAFEAFDRATALDPSYLDARFNKASVLLDAGDFERAKQELSTIVQKNPDDLAARVSLGVAQRGTKQFDQAKQTWEQVVNDAPRRSRARADALFDLAILRADFQEDPKGAKEYLDRFLHDAPGNHPKRAAAEEKKKELGL